MGGLSRFDGQLRWLHKVRLYPTCAQRATLLEMLRATRTLYNALLEERKEAYRRRGIRVTAKMQYAEITALRAEDQSFACVYR